MPPQEKHPSVTSQMLWSFGHIELCGSTTAIISLRPLKCCGLWQQETVVTEDHTGGHFEEPL